jgi:hypothetical protein
MFDPMAIPTNWPWVRTQFHESLANVCDRQAAQGAQPIRRAVATGKQTIIERPGERRLPPRFERMHVRCGERQDSDIDALRIHVAETMRVRKPFLPRPHIGRRSSAKFPPAVAWIAHGDAGKALQLRIKQPVDLMGVNVDPHAPVLFFSYLDRHRVLARPSPQQSRLSDRYE